MKINDVIKEGFYDNPGRSTATGKDYFIKSVEKQLFAYLDSARVSGQKISTMEFVDSYLSKYGWVASPEQHAQLQALSTQVDNAYSQQAKQPTPQAQAEPTPAAGVGQDHGIEPTMEGKVGDFAKSVGSSAANWGKQYINQKLGQAASKLGFGAVDKLANLMYMVGMSQRRDSRTNQANAGSAAPKMEPAGNQAISTVKNMKGPKYVDDLEEIVKLALWNLHGSDKADYSDFVKDIFARRSQTQQNPQQNPQA